MKKTLLILGAIILVLMVALASIPFFFKDQIKEGVDAAIAESVNAQINYQNFDLSLLSTFPNLGIAVEQVSVVGKDLFLGDTLISTHQAQIRVGLGSVLWGDQVKIKSVDLLQPRILIKVLDDGTTNYDIANSSDSTEQEDGSYNIKINGWNVTQGRLVYDDQQSKFFLELDQLDHQGSGDFTSELFDLETYTEGHLVTAQYDGISYLGNKHLQGDVTLEIDLGENRYTFKENNVSLNEFAFGFDGWLELPQQSDDIVMDLTFAAQQNDFQSFLSLVPGMYTENFGDIKSDGLVEMAGLVKGVYNESGIPAFDLGLKVTEGMFQYPDLPQAVENINLDLNLVNEDGQVASTLIDIKNVHLDFGQNPVDGRIKLDGLERSEVDADLKAQLNLTELTKMVPLDGTNLRGNFDLSLKANGTYDSARRQFPTIDAQMALIEGYVKSDQFPEALEEFNFQSRVQNTNGRMEQTLIEIPRFSFVMDGEPFSGNLVLQNLTDYQWDLLIDGSIDLEKLTHIFPQPDKTITGRVSGNLATKGKMSDLEAEKYHLLPTSGSVTVNNFTYNDPDLAHAFHIEKGKAQFDPQKITIQELQANTGSSDMQVQGTLTNYINYVFKDDAVIKGDLQLTSSNLDLNEWMTESGDSSDAAPMEVLEIPKNVDLRITPKAGRVHYDNMTLSDVQGGVIMKGGVASLQDVTFNSLGGRFAMRGDYDSRDLKHPKFNLDMAIADVAVKQAFNTFNTVKVLAPVAKLVDGDFSTNFNLNGELGQDMMPLLNTISGGGLVQILEAALAGANSKIVEGLSNLTKFSSDGPSQFSLKDVVMQIEIKDGKLNVKPFNVNFGDYQTLVSGSTGIDGSIEFLLNIEVPAGVVGSSVNEAIAKLTGSDEPANDLVKLNVKMGGTYNNPSFVLGGREGGATTASIAKDAVDQKVEEAKDSAHTVVDDKTQEVKEQATAQLDSLINDQISDSTSNELLKEVKDNVLKDKSVDDVFNLFKKKKKTEADSTQNRP